MAGAGSTHGALLQAAPLVASWGELLWDLYPDDARLGGASANVAYHVAQLGCRSLLVSRVGRDALGMQALRAMTNAGVDVHHVTVDPERATGHVHVTFEDGEPRFRIGEAVAWDRIKGSVELSAALDQASVFCFGTLAQRTPAVRGALMRELVRLRARGSASSLDTSQRPLCLLDMNLRPPFTEPELLLESAGVADVVKLNEHELEHMAHLCQRAGIASDPITWLLHDKGVQLVAVTRGAAGALLQTRHVRVDQPGFASSGTDSVGAGDAFTATLAVGFAIGKPLPEIAEEACRYAAWVAGQAGAQPKAQPPRWPFQ